MINIQFVFGFIGAAIGLIIGIMVFGQIAGAINCPGEVGSTNSLGVKITETNKNQYLILSKQDSGSGTVGDTTSTKGSATAQSGSGSVVQTTQQTMDADIYNPGKGECQSAKSTAWTVMGILPITLFFVLFSIFGAFGRQE